MSDWLVKADAQWGIAQETTVGTAVNATQGMPNFSFVSLEHGQEWIEERKATGKTVLTVDEVIPDNMIPTWTGAETAISHPQFGELVSLLTQKVAETGVGPSIASGSQT